MRSLQLQGLSINTSNISFCDTYVNTVHTIRQFAGKFRILRCRFGNVVLFFRLLHFNDITVIIVIIAIIFCDIAVALLAGFTPASLFCVLVSER